MTQATELVEVTQGDREAFHAIQAIECSSQPFWAINEGVLILEGHYDKAPRLQAFARHRLTTTAALRADNERLRRALEAMLAAVCGEDGFANAVRRASETAYPWPALDFAEELARQALATQPGEHKEESDGR
jgi:hypothetical protein